jgi:hypothetical protein
LRDLDQRQPDVVMQHEDCPLIYGNSPEGALELVTVSQNPAAIGRAWTVDVDYADVGRELTPAPELGITGMDENALRPSLEAIYVAQMRQLLPGRDEGVLQRVFGSTRLAQDSEGDRVEGIADLAYQAGESFSVATPGPLDDGWVHTDLLTCRA